MDQKFIIKSQINEQLKAFTIRRAIIEVGGELRK